MDERQATQSAPAPDAEVGEIGHHGPNHEGVDPVHTADMLMNLLRANYPVSLMLDLQRALPDSDALLVEEETSTASATAGDSGEASI